MQGQIYGASVIACDTQSEKVIQCSADGLSFTTNVDCGATNQVCIAAKCARWCAKRASNIAKPARCEDAA